jgi:hypothetical protein
MAQHSSSKMGPRTQRNAINSVDSPSITTSKLESAPFLRLYNPSPEEIKQKCVEIRKNWSLTECRRRREAVAPLSACEMPFLRVFQVLRGI